MKWLVQFKEKKKVCCPTRYYWSVTDTIIVADTEQEVLEKLKKGRIAVEIQKISPHE